MADGKKKSYLSTILAGIAVLVLGGYIVIKNIQSNNTGISQDHAILAEKVVPAVKRTLDSAKTWNDLEKDLPSFEKEQFGPYVKVIEIKLPQYREMIKQFAYAKGMQIDFIANAHSRNGMSSDDVESSQKKTGVLLESVEKDCIGIEGSSCENFTIPCFTKETQDELKGVYGVELTDASASQGVNAISHEQATIGYALAHPGAAMSGVESQALHLLHDMTLNAMATIDPSSKEFSRFEKFSTEIGNARSDLAVAHMIEYMRKNKKKHGVIVFGAAHADRFRELAEQLGLVSVIYHAEGPPPS